MSIIIGIIGIAPAAPGSSWTIDGSVAGVSIQSARITTGSFDDITASQRLVQTFADTQIITPGSAAVIDLNGQIITRIYMLACADGDALSAQIIDQSNTSDEDARTAWVPVSFDIGDAVTKVVFNLSKTDATGEIAELHWTAYN